MHRLSRSQKGFTMIEILIVVVIIGILAAIAGGNFMTTQTRARDGVRRADVQAISQALEQYYSTSGTMTYPAIAEKNTCDMTVLSDFFSGSVPVDPRSDAPYYCHVSVARDTYCVCAALEIGRGGNAEEQGNEVTDPEVCKFNDSEESPWFCRQQQQ